MGDQQDVTVVKTKDTISARDGKLVNSLVGWHVCMLHFLVKEKRYLLYHNNL